MFADSRYADIEKKCQHADIADAYINIDTPLIIWHYGFKGCLNTVVDSISKLSKNPLIQSCCRILNDAIGS